LRPYKSLIIIFPVVLFLFLGCSHNVDPTGPIAGTYGGQDHLSAHNLFGLYTFICCPEEDAVEVMPLRNSELHLNALKLLEPPPYLYLTLESKPTFSGNVLDVDIGLTHPFSNQAVYTGFDVCGIVFAHGTLTGFSDPSIVTAGTGDTKLLNADGYTRWWNPGEFPHDDTIFAYKDGLLGNPADNADFNCTVNGYKYFADGLGPNDPLETLDLTKRGVFGVGMKNIRHYKIDLSGGLIFNYAVDACWKLPAGNPPYTVPDDFPPGANRPEPWNMSITEIENDLYYVGFAEAGGNLRILLDVWDHFDAGLNKVYAESPAGLPVKAALNPIGGGEGYSTYELDFMGEYLTQNGDAELFIAVQSDAMGYGGILPGIPVTAYFKRNFNISPNFPPAWARTWGGENYNDPGDIGYGVAVDDSGNVYVAGRHDLAVDFDPGLGIDIHPGGGTFLSKFDSNGNYKWARTWAAFAGYDVAVDGSGNVYVVGDFSSTVDFDPGPGVDLHTCNGGDDSYLCKFSPNGDFQWARTWGGKSYDGALTIDIGVSGTIYATGVFWGVVDFDPGPGIDKHSSNGGNDIFLSSFNAEGEFLWARTWGSSINDWPGALSVNSMGDIYVTGYCWASTDFDPGPGIDEHSNPGTFLSKFDSSGAFKWALTWGNDNPELSSVGTDDEGNVYVAGSFVTYPFQPPVDFDPGPGTENHKSKGHGEDAYLSKFDTAGNFQWVQIWGGKSSDVALDLFVVEAGPVHIVGYFGETCDFDPGPGILEYTSHGIHDVFVTKFDSSGGFQWARAFGGTDEDWGWSVAADGPFNAYVAGYFHEVVDFDPGAGTDFHSANGTSDAFLCKFPSDGNW